MATVNVDVKLTGPDNWKSWNERFRSEATTRDLWELIDPKGTSKGQFKTAPIKPAIKDYPKRLDRADAPPAQSTRAGSVSSSVTVGESQALAIGPPVEEIDRRNPPRNTSEMTALGRDAYRTDLSAYHFEWQLYEAERQNLNRLTAWIRQTVAPQLYDTTCKADKTIDLWYATLKERAGSDDREELQQSMKHPEHRESRTCTSSPAPRPRQHTPNRSRSRSPGARGVRNHGHKRKHTGGAKSGCLACDGLHPLSGCWALFPELRPSYYPPAYRREFLAKERLEKDPELRRQVEALQSIIEALASFLGMMELQFGIKIKAVEADNEIFTVKPCGLRSVISDSSPRRRYASSQWRRRALTGCGQGEDQRHEEQLEAPSVALAGNQQSASTLSALTSTINWKTPFEIFHSNPDERRKLISPTFAPMDVNHTQ
ncbi:predicted protein [Chaetomium globosum CBS 148.51]|uniref:Uncharacterized protein n=1 Tax=Chaetomium globosum (strain ATCC 6205 / CBS 148.51 / DSM 1962 / NBRC 6347 / NRRL 1970) TaxID=306901 RepID=Q2H5P2_CHAGB|nr:uncharacterized protein CHGG_06023 [Chaetomium globosum CBS 148.51]EAQ89404.1 predicted protein [Chaetomium globosum CBS 148.51]